MKFFNLDKKKLILLYFIVFIVLNVVDFLNLLSSDLDFFKKLLSWSIIGYIFYKASLSEVFVGIRALTYDLALILAFCFFTIPKSLVLYKMNIDLSVYKVFGGIIGLVSNSDFFLPCTFMIGLGLTVVFSIALLVNNEVQEKSFIGSFNFKEGYFKYIFEQFLLTFVLIFFGLIVFNFFMEWFALAVDAVVLVLGLVYYMIRYIHRHMSGRFYQVLLNISNTGNGFYKNLILLFSDKKTIFVGISFLLTLHLLVDVGVYMVPYSIGTQNTLYFSSLDYHENGVIREHYPMFNFFDFTDSLFVNDVSVMNGRWDLVLGVFLVYFVSLFLVYFLMIFPFYLFYNNVLKKRVRLNKYVAILFVAVLIAFCVLYFLDGIRSPILMGYPMGGNVKGVDFYTSSVYYDGNGSNVLEPEMYMHMYIFMFLFLISIVFLLGWYEKYNFFFNKFILIVVLMFFVFYIIIFFTSTVEEEFNGLQSSFEGLSSDKEQVEMFDYAYGFYESDSFYKNQRMKIEYNRNSTLKSVLVPFSTLEIVEGNFVKYSEIHQDYVLVEVMDCDLSTRIGFDSDKFYLEDESVYDVENQVFRKSSFKGVYYLGDNNFSLSLRSGDRYSVGVNFKESNLEDIFVFGEYKVRVMAEVNRWIEFLRLFLVSVFYVCGTFSFVFYYFRRDILNVKD